MHSFYIMVLINVNALIIFYQRLHRINPDNLRLVTDYFVIFE